jgi:3-deoxy-7-phosphoheptulonate synthase
MLIRMDAQDDCHRRKEVREVLDAAGAVVREVDGSLVVCAGPAEEALGKWSGLVDRTPIATPYKLVNRAVRPSGTRIHVGGIEIGGDEFFVAAGPCAVENEAQLENAAEAVAAAGARILRGGAFKPRSSPYAFQGLKEKGLELLARAGRRWGMPVVTEVLTAEDVPLVASYADILQIGARNMQNFPLLQAVGRVPNPVLLKRALSGTLDEFLLAAEYIALEGNMNIILCERGIRTFETATRNTLDLAGAVLVGKRTHLPVFVDPSHATGRRELVAPLSAAAAAVGLAGLIVEVHPEPEKALCDGAQSVAAADFRELMDGVESALRARGRRVPDPSPALGADVRLSLETRRLEAQDRMLAGLLAARETTGLRIEQLRSKIGRPPGPPSVDDGWDAKTIGDSWHRLKREIPVRTR